MEEESQPHYAVNQANNCHHKRQIQEWQLWVTQLLSSLT